MLRVSVLNCGGKMLDLSQPAVMGILNVTPDSFYDGGAFTSVGDQLKQAEKMIKEGAAIIDIGAASTRPGAKTVDEKQELSRLLPILSVINKYFPACIISVDTYHSAIAGAAIENGAGMINDIYGGRFDEKMVETVTSKNIPYVILHMQGTPQTMQLDPEYTDVVKAVEEFFTQQIKLFPSGYDQIIQIGRAHV